MIFTILIILIVLWFLGYTPISSIHIPNATLFSLNNHPITLWNILIMLVVGWAISELPSPFREIASALLLFWVLSTIGILAIAGLSNILILAIIIGIALYALSGNRAK